MQVEQLMTRDVKAAREHDTLQAAAQIMWDRNCGCVPIVDADNRVVGIITDRDICLAAFAQSKTLSRMHVGDSMARRVHTCRVDDTLAYVEALMQQKQVRRLPVVDSEDQLVGIISLHDLAREAQREMSLAEREVCPDEVGLTLAAVSAPASRLHHGPAIL